MSRKSERATKYGLADQHCVPCRGGVPALEPERVEQLLGELEADWSLNERGHLERGFAFTDFVEALAFVNRVGEIAESEGHHPDLHLGWGRCRVEIWTHAINGLTESDFILAAKIEVARTVGDAG